MRRLNCLILFSDRSVAGIEFHTVIRMHKDGIALSDVGQSLRLAVTISDNLVNRRTHTQTR